ncbi:MAG: ComEC/Rec2 family competence protein [Planctomycetota bacterium]|nr:MAG: ComEC/Rec2 family competence protein [Planctomycetota bacterium]
MVAGLLTPDLNEPGYLQRAAHTAGPWLPWLAAGYAVGCAWPDALLPPWLLWQVLASWCVLVPLLLWQPLALRPIVARALVCVVALLSGMWVVDGYSQSHLPPEQFIERSMRVERVLYEGYGIGFIAAPEGRDLPRRIAVHAPAQVSVRTADVVMVRGRLQHATAPWGELRSEVRAVDLHLQQRRETGPRGFAWRAIEGLGQHRDLGGALLLGEGRPRARDAFHQAGLLHFLAVSGLHLGLALVMWAWVMRLLGLPWLLRQVLLVGGALGYAWLVGFSMPTQRAAVMTIAVVAYSLQGRSAHRLGPLSLAVLVLLAMDPSQARNIGFQLSAVAVFGIVTMGMDLVALRRRFMPLYPWPLDRPSWRALLYVCRGALDGMAVGIAATLAVMPITAGNFAEITPWSPLVSVLAGPFLMLVLAAGLPMLMLQGLWPSGPWSGLFVLTQGGLSGLVWMAEQAPQWFRYSLLSVPAPGLALWLSWYAMFLPISRVEHVLWRGLLLIVLLLPGSSG